jgi:hypothetical protein
LQTTRCFHRDGIRLLDEQVAELAVPRRSKIKLIFSTGRCVRFVDESFCRLQFICANRIRCLPASIRCWIEVTLSVWVCDCITPAFSHTVGKETTNPNATRRSKQKLNKAGPLIPVKQKQHLNVLPLCWMHTRERTRKLQEYCLVHTAAYASTTSTTRVQRLLPQRHRVWLHWLYINLAVRCNYSSPGRTGSTSTTPYAAVTSSSGCTTTSTTHLD